MVGEQHALLAGGLLFSEYNYGALARHDKFIVESHQLKKTMSNLSCVKSVARQVGQGWFRASRLEQHPGLTNWPVKP